MAEATPASATPGEGACKPKGKRVRAAKKEKKNIPHAIATVQASFNNTIIAIADQEGGVLAWSSAGRIGFKGSRKGTPFAAQLAAANCAEQRQGARRALGRRARDGPRAPAASPPSGRSRPTASTSSPSRTRRRSRTTDAGRGSGGESRQRSVNRPGVVWRLSAEADGSTSDLPSVNRLTDPGREEGRKKTRDRGGFRIWLVTPNRFAGSAGAKG